MPNPVYGSLGADDELADSIHGLDRLTTLFRNDTFEVKIVTATARTDATPFE